MGWREAVGIWYNAPAHYCPEGSKVIGEQKAKALFAGGIALFVTGLVVLMLFVIPAARHSQVAMAQEDMMPPPPEGMPPGDMPPPEGGAYPGPAGGFPGPGEAGMMPMAGGAAAAPAAAAGVTVVGADPLEPSRPNPFAPRAATAVAEAAAALAATTYGPDWSRLPIAERVAFVAPEIPPAPTPPLPRLDEPPETEIRITSILWDASGQAQAAYEDEEGKTGVLKPGDRIQGYTVTQITRSGVILENPRTGERLSLELRPRTEKKEEERRPQRRPGARGGQQGGQPPAGGRRPGRRPPPEFPAAPPG